MSEYKPKKGDRVRVTRVLEGTYREGGLSGNVRGATGIVAWSLGAWGGDIQETVEKLPDPEPKWVHGATVTLANGDYPRHYDTTTDKWRMPSGVPVSNDSVTKAWEAGTLKILWNGDPE